MNIPDEAVEAAWKVMEPRFLGMNRERCRDSLILALDAAMPHIRRQLAEEIRALSQEPGICDLCRGREQAANHIEGGDNQ